MKIGDIAFNVNSSEYVFVSGGFIDKDNEFVVTEFLSLRAAGSGDKERVLLGFKRHKNTVNYLEECNQEAAQHTKFIFELLINNSWFSLFKQKPMEVGFIGEV